MGKHTPGPWENVGPNEEGEQCIYGADDSAVAVTIPVGVPDARPDRSEANARLVAAAPELLDFVKHVRELAFDFVNDGDRPQIHHMRDLAWCADKALIKATGESHE